MIRPALLVTPALLMAAACARDAAADQYPSLARRPAEGQGFAEPELPAPGPVAAEPVLDQQTAALRTRLASVAAGFDRDAAAAERAATAARGRAVGSEAWLTAQSALAELDDWRAQASALANEAEEAAVARAAELRPDYPALEATRAALRTEIERQTDMIARLQRLTPAA